MRPHVSDDIESETLESDSGVPTISSPEQSQPCPLNRNRFDFIWPAWHFSDNSQQTQDAGRLFQMRPVYEYFQFNSTRFNGFY
jgi:hypothetical protein